MNTLSTCTSASAPIHHKPLVGLKSILLASSLALGFMAQPAQAVLTFDFNYVSPGEGFDEIGFSADRKAALDSAANMLGSYFTNYTATLTYNVTSYTDSTGENKDVLASAGSTIYGDAGPFGKTVVQAKILSNGAVDYNNGAADGVINWNFAFNWGLDDTVADDEMDFKSTAMHELMHSFGFLSDIYPDGTGAYDAPPGEANLYSSYDYFLTNAAGEYLIDADGVFDPSKVGALTAGTYNAAGVLFDGENARAANDGNAVPIYSPNPWEEGSSLSHPDDNSDVTDNLIMNAVAHGYGLDVRTLSDIEIGMLKDLGYTEITAVPVPAAIWLLGSGFMAMFGFARKQKLA